MRRSQKDIDNLLYERQLKRKGTFNGVERKTDIICLKCGYEWSKRIADVINKNSGCPKCYSISRKLKTEDVNKKLNDIGLTLLSQYNCSSEKIKLSCKKGHIFYLTMNRITTAKNKDCLCKECKNDNKNNILFEKLSKKGLTFIDKLKINGYTKIVFRCEHGHDNIMDMNRINTNQIKCKTCNKGFALKEEDVKNHLKKRDIKILEPYTKTEEYYRFSCLKCGHEWITKFNNIIYNKSGCPKCAGLIKLTNEDVDIRIKDRNIIRIGNYVNVSTKIEWKCKIDSYVWMAKPNDIFSGYGCPYCKNKNEGRIYKFLKDKYKDVKYQNTVKFNNRKYIVDFVVNGVFIEYNGKQHYEPVEYFGGEERFKKQQKRDQELKEYCKEKNIKLIEIPCWLSEDKQYELIENGINNVNNKTE